MEREIREFETLARVSLENYMKKNLENDVEKRSFLQEKPLKFEDKRSENERIYAEVTILLDFCEVFALAG